MAVEAHFGGKCIDAGCVDGLRIPVKMEVYFHSGFTYILSLFSIGCGGEVL